MVVFFPNGTIIKQFNQYQRAAFPQAVRYFYVERW